MKPQPQNYTVHEVEGGFQVHTTYDLFHLNKPHPRGLIYSDCMAAFIEAHRQYEYDLKDCERQKSKGRSWPEND